MATRGKRKTPTQHNKNERGSPSNSRPYYHQRYIATNNSPSEKPHYTEGVYKNKRLVHIMTSLVGSEVEAEKISGEVYEGILRTVSPHMEFVLELAYVKPPLGQPISKSSLIPTLVLKWNEVARITTATPNGGGGANSDVSKEIFKMDSDIATPTHGGTNGHHEGKELEPFQFDDSSPPKVSEDDVKGSERWTFEEMLDTNKEKFNVGSTYNPEMTEYTVPLILTGADQFRIEEANRKAREIESGINQSISDKDIDEESSEEQRFSSVIRPNEVPQEGQQKLPTECAKGEEEEVTPLVVNGGNEGVVGKEVDTANGEKEDDKNNEDKKEDIVPSTPNFKLNPDAMEFKPLGGSPASSSSTHSPSPSLPPRSQRSLRGSGLRNNLPRPPIFTPQDQSGLYGGLATGYLATGSPIRMMQPHGSIASPTGLVSMMRPSLYGSQLIGHQQGGNFYSVPTSLATTSTHPTLNQAALLGHPGGTPHGIGLTPHGNVVYVPVPFGQYSLTPTSPLGPGGGGGGGSGILSYPQP